ncbi:MAG: hypothetical protein MJZ20_02925 [Bacteroidaceae bacterium]|nr:hypothetical protein [Bacteroidaceae bacterium]
MAQNFNLQLNIGFNDKDTKVQLLPTEECIDMVLDIVNDIIGDCTVLPTVGTYTHDDGHRVREHGCQVTACIFDTSIEMAKNLLAKASQRIGKALNQEAIVTNVTNLTSELTPVIY